MHSINKEQQLNGKNYATKLLGGYMKFNKNVKVVQLWHGTGTIKKFGLDSDTGEVKRLAKKANENITHLIV